MKVRAVIVGNKIIFKDPVILKKDEIEVDVEIPDKNIDKPSESEGKKFLLSLWNAVGNREEENINWKEEWHKHLEEKYE